MQESTLVIHQDQNINPQSSVENITESKLFTKESELDTFDVSTSQVPIQSEIADLFQSIKKRSHYQRSELRQKHQKELIDLSNKYKQIKEQLRVQQELMNNRERTERTLQDQLNKATIELAQLRLVRDDLNSSLKQSSAQVQYLNRELEKMRETTSKGENERQQNYFLMKEKLASNEQEMERIKNDFQVESEKLKVEKDQLKTQLQAARKQMDQWQDENFRLINEARSISSQYESEKADYVRNQQKNSQLQTKLEKLTEIFSQTRDENEKLKNIVDLSKSDYQAVSLKYDKCISERDLFQNQAKSLNDQLKEKIAQLRNAELAAQTAQTKYAASEDEINHSKGLLEKTKQNLLSEINNLNQKYQHEKESGQNLRDKCQKVTEELADKSAELEHEKFLREKVEQSENSLKQRVSQTESILQESEKERFLLSQQIQKLNNELETKVHENENIENSLRESLKENAQLKESLTDSQQKIESISSMVNAQTLEEVKQNLLDKMKENQELVEKVKNLQRQNKDINMNSERILFDKQSDTQTINELHETLRKERQNLKSSIQERKEIQEANQNYRQELIEVKRQLSKLQTDLSLANAENAHAKDMLNENQININSLTEEKNKLENDLNFISDSYRDEKSAHAVISSEVETLRKENIDIKKKLNQYKINEKTLNEKIDIIGKEMEIAKTNEQNAYKDINIVKNRLEDLNLILEESKTNFNNEQKEKEKAILKCSTLNSQITSYVSALKRLNNQLKKTKSALSEKSKQLTDISIQFEQLKDLNDHLDSENDSISSENQKLTSRLQEIEKKLQDEQNEKNELNSKISSDIQDTIDQLKKEKNSLLKQVSEMEQQLKETQEQTEELHDVINNLQNEVNESQIEENKMKNKCYDLQREISENETTIQSLKSHYQEQTELLTQTRDEKKLLKDQIDNLEQQSKADLLNLETKYSYQIELLKTKFHTSNDSLEKFEQEQKDKILSLECEKSTLQKEIRKLKRQSSQVVQKLKSITEQFESITHQREELIAENSELKSNLISQIQSFNILDQQNKKTNKERNDLLDIIQQLNIKNGDLASDSAKLIETKSKLEQTQANLMQLQEQMQSLKALNDGLQTEINDSIKSRDDANKEFEEIMHTVHQIHLLLKPSDETSTMNLSTNGTFLQELSTLRNLLITSQKDIESFIQQRNQLLQEVCNNRKNLAKLNEAQIDYVNQLTKANEKIDKLQNEVKSLKEDNSKYNIERQNLNDALTKIRNALQMTKERLTSSETEKKLLKDDSLKMKILIDKICDDHKINLQELEKAK